MLWFGLILCVRGCVRVRDCVDRVSLNTGEGHCGLLIVGRPKRESVAYY